MEKFYPLEKEKTEVQLNYYRSKLLPYAYNIVGDSMEAEDVVQEILNKLKTEFFMKKERINYQEAPKEIYELMLNIEAYLKKCGIDHSLIELIKVRASQINGCGYCLDMHYKDALKAGETLERLYLLPAWEESPVYSEKEKGVLNLTEVLTDLSTSSAGVIEEAYQKLSKHYSKTQIAQIVFAICQINSWNRIAITFGNIPGSYEVS